MPGEGLWGANSETGRAGRFLFNRHCTATGRSSTREKGGDDQPSLTEGINGRETWHAAISPAEFELPDS